MPAHGAVTHGRPLCRCHGEPMTRRNDRRSGWRCSVAHRLASQTYYHADPERSNYARTRRALRARIEAKRQRIAQMEARLEEENTHPDGAGTGH